LLFASPDRWNRVTIDAAVATGTTRTVRLPKPVPVLMLYWTVDRDDQGAIVFKPDPYGRDPKLLKALDRPFARASPSNSSAQARLPQRTRPTAQRVQLSGPRFDATRAADPMMMTGWLTQR
jgi:hypothetical protein